MSLDVYLTETRPVEVFERNIAHNLRAWRMRRGFTSLFGGPNCRPRRRPNLSARSVWACRAKGRQWRFKEYEPENGWGRMTALSGSPSRTWPHVANIQTRKSG